MKDRKPFLCNLLFNPINYDTPEKLDRFYSENYEKMKQYVEEQKLVIVNQTDLPSIRYIENKQFLLNQDTSKTAIKRGIRYQLSKMKFTSYKSSDCNGNVYSLPNFSFLIGHSRKMPNIFVRIICRRYKQISDQRDKMYLVHIYKCQQQSVQSLSQNESNLKEHQIYEQQPQIQQQEQEEELEDDIESVELYGKVRQHQSNDDQDDEEEYKNEIEIQGQQNQIDLLQNEEQMEECEKKESIITDSFDEIDGILPQINLSNNIKIEYQSQQPFVTTITTNNNSNNNNNFNNNQLQLLQQHLFETFSHINQQSHSMNAENTEIIRQQKIEQEEQQQQQQLESNTINVPIAQNGSFLNINQSSNNQNSEQNDNNSSNNLINQQNGNISSNNNENNQQNYNNSSNSNENYKENENYSSNNRINEQNDNNSSNNNGINQQNYNISSNNNGIYELNNNNSSDNNEINQQNENNTSSNRIYEQNDNRSINYTNNKQNDNQIMDASINQRIKQLELQLQIKQQEKEQQKNLFQLENNRLKSKIEYYQNQEKYYEEMIQQLQNIISGQQNQNQ